MNFCTKCGSYYSEPGTCNCFATKHVTYPGTGTDHVCEPDSSSSTRVCRHCGRIMQPPDLGTTTIRVETGDFPIVYNNSALWDGDA